MADLVLEHIDIEVNHRCNLACRHCSARAAKGRLTEELTTTEIQDVLPVAMKLGLRKVGLTGGDTSLENALRWMFV